MKYYILLTIIFLASCARGPEKARKRIAEYRNDYPQLFQDSVIVDTVKTTVSVQIPSKPIDVGVIDSLLEEYCSTDTVYLPSKERKQKTIEGIKSLCKLSALLPIETIKRTDSAVMRVRVITLPDGTEAIDPSCEVLCENKTITVYAPCPEITFWDLFKMFPWQMFGVCFGWLVLGIFIMVKVALK